MKTKLLYLTMLALTSAFTLIFSSTAQSASGYIYAPPLAAYNISSSSGFTVEAWVKSVALPGFDPRIFRISSQCLNCLPDGTDVFDLHICNHSCTTGLVTCSIRDEGTNIVPFGQSAVNINDGSFHHVACSYDGNAIQVYIDGNSSGSPAVIGAHDLNFSSGSMVLANSNVVSPPDNNPLDGLIDEVRIWNTARSQTEIAGNMGMEISPSSPNLIGYWKLNGTYADETAAANSLIPGGTVTFQAGELSQAAHVVNENVCGNGLCDPGETSSSCPADCFAVPIFSRSGLVTFIIVMMAAVLITYQRRRQVERR